MSPIYPRHWPEGLLRIEAFGFLATSYRKTENFQLGNAQPTPRFRVNIASYPRVLEESFRCLLKRRSPLRR
jgi:hypothetical protein